VTFHPQKRGLRRHSQTVQSLWQGDCSNTLHNVLRDSAKKVCQDANNRTLYSRKAAIPHLEWVLEWLSSSGNSCMYYVPPFSSLLRCIPKRSKLPLKSKENNEMTCREWKAGIAMQHCNEEQEQEQDIAVRRIWILLMLKSCSSDLYCTSREQVTRSCNQPWVVE
jgi:hypothetical protein